MDYEKLHKETINRLQQIVSCGKITVETACGICADFVPESEDERIRKSLSTYFANFKPNDMWDADFSFGDIVAWFERQALRPQNQWRPSEEQMKFLYKYAEQNNYDGAILTSLYNDLKQLKQYAILQNSDARLFPGGIGRATSD
jgi:hypothetical protein